MAEKRMVSNQILNSDEFTDMPVDAQMLYVRLNLAADDRGICDKPRQVMNICRSPDDCMKLLIAKKFIIVPTGRPSVVVIKHWWINNNFRSQRFKETRYTDVLEELYYDENKSYSKNPENHFPCMQNGALVGLPLVDQWLTNGRPAVDHWLPQYSIVQNSIDKSSTVKVSTGKEECERGNPETPDPDTRIEKIKSWKHRVDIFKNQGFDASPMYNLAFSTDGITKEEIDSYKEDIPNE